MGEGEEEEKENPKMTFEIDNYEVSKRWLARMMGADPDNFTQEDIDESIQYLLPSHLWAKDARPTLKHPRDIFYAFIKPDPFDQFNRPKESAYFTRKPKFFDVLFDIGMEQEKLDLPKDSNIVSRTDHGEAEIVATEEDELETLVAAPKPMRWVNKLELEQILNEPLIDEDYNLILFRLKKLAKHERANEVNDLLLRYQLPMHSSETILKAEDICVSENFVRAIGYRKTSMADVLLCEGSGVVTVNNKPFIDYFKNRNEREQIMLPLVITDTLNRFDIDANVVEGGPCSQAGAARLALSRAIAAFCPELFQALNDAQLLIHDRRRKERKKPGLKKARKGPTYKRR